VGERAHVAAGARVGDGDLAAAGHEIDEGPVAGAAAAGVGGEDEGQLGDVAAPRRDALELRAAPGAAAREGRARSFKRPIRNQAVTLRLSENDLNLK
jgi:hypothetical protein